MKTAAAQHLFNIIQDQGFNKDTVAILRVLVSSGQASMDEVVDAARARAPLGRALLGLADPGFGAGQFYTREVARELIGIDPLFFNQPARSDSGYPWIEYNLHGWVRNPERDRYGFSARPGARADEWALEVLKSLPEKRRASPVVWESCLRMGLAGSANYLAPLQAGGWAAVDRKGNPALKFAGGGWAWDAALEAGLDPYAKTAKGGPIWRELLPGSSSSPAEQGSLRARVEAWVRGEIDKPGADPGLMDYLRRHTVARMKNSMGPNAWNKLSHKQQVEHARGLPDEWVGWDLSGMPAWVRMVGAKGTTPAGWALEVGGHEGWMAHIRQDPLSMVALEVFGGRGGLPVAMDGVDLARVMADPRARATLAWCARAAGAEAKAIEPWLDGLQMHASTNHAAPGRQGPRF